MLHNNSSKNKSWRIDCVLGDKSVKTEANFHTHGLEETFDHINFQIIAPVPVTVANRILGSTSKI